MKSKIVYSCLLLAMLSAFLLVQAPLAHSEQTDTPKKAIEFLTDVVQLDLTKYNVNISGYKLSYPTPPLLSNPAVIVQEDLKYTLESEGSKVDAIFGFKNGTFWWCNLYIVEGTPIYAEPQPGNEIAQAEGVLERYHAYNEVPNFQVTRALLGSLSNVENTVAKLGSTSLKVTKDSESTRFEWSQGYNGAKTTTLNIRFTNGHIRSFTNSLCLETIGGTDIAISEDQAIEIAVKQAEIFSWKVGTDSNSMIEVTDFTILTSPVKAELSMQPREGTTLYPYWIVELYLDKIYPGGVSSIIIGLWADTGEIHLIQELSYGGSMMPQTTPTPAAESTPLAKPTNHQQTNTPDVSQIDLTIGVTVAALVIAVALTAIVLKKRNK